MKRFAYVAAFLSLLLAPAFALGCNPGAAECVDASTYRTCTQYAVWGEQVSCLGGQQCINGACEERLGCSPGTRECVDTFTYKLCNDFALWDPPAACPSGGTCNNGVCSLPRQCQEYQQTRCNPDDQNNVQICNSQYQWESWRNCDYGCDAGYCRTCRPGMTRCADSYSYQTCDGNGQWGSDSSCQKDYVCDGGSCIISPLIKCDSIGAYRCSPDNSNVLQQCAGNHRWGDYTYCQLGCSSGACRACNYGEKKCKDSSTYLNCGSGGQWGSETSCPTGYFCFSGSCQVPTGSQCSAIGAKRCSPGNPSMVQMCNNNYIYADYLQCNDGCYNGICAECKPGTSLCSGVSTYRTCTKYGQLSGPQSCDAGYTCDNGQCVATPACTDGQRNCVSDAVYSCTNGQWELLFHCPPDTDCKEGSGTAYCAAEIRPGKNQSSGGPDAQPSQQQGTATPSGTLLEALLGITTLVFAAAAVYIWTTRKK